MQQKRDFFDESTWGVIVNDLDRRTRKWATTYPQCWQELFVAYEHLRQFGDAPVPMRLVLDLARFMIKAKGMRFGIATSSAPYIAQLMHRADPDAETYLSQGNKPKDIDDLSLEN